MPLNPNLAIMATSFLRFWANDQTRERLFDFIPKEDLPAVRLVCYDFGTRSAPRLFEDLTVTFKPTTFTKPARLAALARIGHHVKTLHFQMLHTPETFLPPLISRYTGQEVEFIYEPYCHINRNSSDRLSGTPTYGCSEVTELLLQQYPPLFHAAANVPTFIKAISMLTEVTHLKISTPGQEPSCRYRRSIVDYALISLRIAVERSPLRKLDSLSLLGVHPSSVHYLNPLVGYGSRPDSTRRWRQIKKLVIHMESFIYDPTVVDAGPDHLKHLHFYLQTFSATVSHLTFQWLGEKGLFPLSLSSEHILEASSPKQACPQSCHLALRPLKFDKLEYMSVENIITDSCQISSFIITHRRSIAEFAFEATTLREGSWDDALEPLSRMTSKRDQLRDGDDDFFSEPEREVMEVPIMLSPPSMEELAEGVKQSVREKQRLKAEKDKQNRCPTPLIDSLGGLWGLANPMDLAYNWDMGMRVPPRGLEKTGGALRQQISKLLRPARLRW